MKENEISISNRAEVLLIDFGKKNNIPVWGPRVSMRSGNKLPKTRFRVEGGQGVQP